MEGQRARVSIVENRRVQGTWGAVSRNGIKHSRVLLYQSNSASQIFNFNMIASSSKDSFDCSLLTAVEQVFKHMESDSRITLQSHYNTRSESCTVWTSATFTTDFLTRLSQQFSQPKICMECTFSKDLQIFYNSAMELTGESPSREMECPRKSYRVSCPREFGWNVVTYSMFFEWIQPVAKKNRLNVLENLFHNKHHADCCIVTGNGTEIESHRFVLQENSDVLNTMITSGFQESQTNRIYLPDLSDEGAKHFLSYLYGIEMNTFNMSGKLVLELFRAAHMYNVASLEKDMLDTLLHKCNKDISVELTFAVYLFTVNVEQFHALRDKCLNTLRINSKHLVTSPTYQNLLEKEPKEAAKFALKLLEIAPN